MANDKGIFAWLVRRPGLVLFVGFASAIVFFGLSAFTDRWHWFPRGGALMASAASSSQFVKLSCIDLRGRQNFATYRDTGFRLRDWFGRVPWERR